MSAAGCHHTHTLTHIHAYIHGWERSVSTHHRWVAQPQLHKRRRQNAITSLAPPRDRGRCYRGSASGSGRGSGSGGGGGGGGGPHTQQRQQRRRLQGPACVFQCFERSTCSQACVQLHVAAVAAVRRCCCGCAASPTTTATATATACVVSPVPELRARQRQPAAATHTSHTHTHTSHTYAHTSLSPALSAAPEQAQREAATREGIRRGGRMVARARVFVVVGRVGGVIRQL